MNIGQIKVLLNTMVIVIDTREKKNEHIIKYLEQKGVKYEIKKINSGDYSAYIPANENIGTPLLEFENLFAVERKKCLDELALNVTKHKDRFYREFDRTTAKMVIVQEEDKYNDLIFHNYRSDLEPQAFNAILQSIYAKYDIPTIHIGDNRTAAVYTLTWLQYHIREWLKVFEVVEE